jgi:hypothetical protein
MQVRCSCDAITARVAAFIAVMRHLLPSAAIACLLCSSCRLFGPAADLTVVLPALPAHWRAAFPDLKLAVVLTDPSGKERRVTGIAGDSTLSIACPKRTNTPILAWPLSSRDGIRGPGEPGYLRPAGALYPLSLDSGAAGPTLMITWEQGPLAVLMSRLAAAGRDVSLFNAERLDSYLRKHPDPWMLDLDAMAQRIADGSFTAYDIDCLPTRDIRFAPGPGTWFFESPFAGIVTAADDSAVDMPGVSLGQHALFSLEGGAWRVQVGAREMTLKRVP